MINEQCKEKVIQFLKSYPDPLVKVASTIIDDHAQCIKPINTICGAEIYCAENAYSDVMRLIKENQQ